MRRIGYSRPPRGVERWAADFTRCALAAKAWAVLANPRVACDVSAHAFENDYRAREEYVGKFVDHVDWSEVAKRYKAVDRM